MPFIDNHFLDEPFHASCRTCISYDVGSSLRTGGTVAGPLARRTITCIPPIILLLEPLKDSSG
jgi:hypothetical protein